MNRARWIGCLPLLALLGCRTAEPLPAPPLRGCLRLEIATSRTLLHWLEQTPPEERPPKELDPLIEGLAFLADGTPAQARAGLRAAVATCLPEARACVETVLRVLEDRSDLIRARVARLIPEEADDGPPLSVVPAFGLPAGQPFWLVGWQGHRALLIDALALGRDAAIGSGEIDRDALGQRLQLAIAPELFHVRFEPFRDGSSDAPPELPSGDHLLARLLNEGVAEYLRMPPEERFDSQGRRPPIHDATARRTLLRFAENLSRLKAGDTSADQRRHMVWSFADGPRKSRWGTYAGALMVDAILRFGPPGRMRAVLRTGPLDLIAAYREICGRYAAVPLLDASTAALLRDSYGIDPIQETRPHGSDL